MSANFEAAQMDQQTHIIETSSLQGALYLCRDLGRNALRGIVTSRAMRSALALGLAASAGVAVGTASEMTERHPGPAHATTTFVDDYPHMAAQLYSATNYEWWVDENSDGEKQIEAGTNDELSSPRGFDYRNCTDGTAYWAGKYTGVTPPGSWGSAKAWDDNATGYTIKNGDANNIEPGDIAQSDDGAWGHVGFVVAVNKNSSGVITSIETAELNEHGDGNYTGPGASETNVYTSKNTSGKFIRWGTNDWDHFIDVNGANKGLNNEALGPGGSTAPKDDYVIYRLNGNAGYWYGKSAPAGTNQINPTWGVNHGSPGDVPVMGDFDGDGYDDFGIYRMEGSAGTWYVKSSGTGGHTAIWGATHGSPGDIPVVGDVNHDGIADFGIYRMGSDNIGRWYFKSGHNGGLTPIWGSELGSPGDIPVVGDVNHDDIDDFGIYAVDSNNNAYWYFKSSGDGQPTPIWGSNHGGLPGDKPVVGDINGDDIDDFGIYRPNGGTGYWYFKSGHDGQPITNGWGAAHGSWSQDVPLMGRLD